LKYLLSAWTDIARQLREANHILLLTDYDGTLTPIVEHPDLANLSENTRIILQTLARQHRITLGVISGRALDDLKEKVGIKGMIYAGNHGLEIEGPGIRFTNTIAEEFRPFLRIMHYVLERTLSTVKGVFIENKGLSLSVHYRLADKDRIEEVGRIVGEVAGDAGAAGKARIVPGKKVYEVRPTVTWNKGNAIKLLMKKYGKGGRRSGLFAIYLGDDVTDEDGFKVINNYGIGLSIYVGEENRQSVAHYYLYSSIEVANFLTMLLEYIQNRVSVHVPLDEIMREQQIEMT